MFSDTFSNVSIHRSLCGGSFLSAVTHCSIFIFILIWVGAFSWKVCTSRVTFEIFTRIKKLLPFWNLQRIARKVSRIYLNIYRFDKKYLSSYIVGGEYRVLSFGRFVMEWPLPWRVHPLIPLHVVVFLLGLPGLVYKPPSRSNQNHSKVSRGNTHGLSTMTLLTVGNTVRFQDITSSTRR